MEKENKKEFIEPEILKDEKNFEKKEDFFSQKINGNFSEIKKEFLLKGFLFLLPYILFFFLIVIFIFWIIFLLFAHPFDYIISTIVLYFMLKSVIKIYNFIKNLKK